MMDLVRSVRGTLDDGPISMQFDELAAVDGNQTTHGRPSRAMQRARPSYPWRAKIFGNRRQKPAIGGVEHPLMLGGDRGLQHH
jgi:hypothetical protein